MALTASSRSPLADMTADLPRATRGSARGKNSSPLPLSGKSKGIILYEAQEDLIREVEFRTKKKIQLSPLMRAALDEYLAAHAADLALTDEQTAQVKARMRRAN